MKISGKNIREAVSTHRKKASKKPSDIKIFNFGRRTNPTPQPNPSTKQDGKVYDFELGERQGNTRIVDANGISTLQGTGRTGQRTNPNGVTSDALTGDVESTSQGKRGDCYLLAEINAIRNTKDGQAILDKNSHYDEATGSYTITLPGAVKVRQAYEKQGLGDKCEITGKYKITKEALDKANKLQGQSYSKGDLKVVAFEIAMENYRAELLQTQKNVGDAGGGEFTAEGSGSKNENDILASGHTYDAGFLLTGQKSDVYKNNNKARNPQKLYKDGEYGYITREEMERQTSLVSASTSLGTAKGVSEVTHVTDKQSDLSKMLDNYSGKEGDYAMTAYVTVGRDGPDGSTKKGGGHAVTIVKITDSTVYVANPWHPDKIEPIPRAEFEKMAYGFVAQNMNESNVDNTYTTNNLNDIVTHHNNSNTHVQQLSGNILNRLQSTLTHVGTNTNNLQTPIHNGRLNNFIGRLNGKIDLQQLNRLATQQMSPEQQANMQKIYQYLQNADVQLTDADIKQFQALLSK